MLTTTNSPDIFYDVMQLPGRYEMFIYYQIPFFFFLHFLDPILMVK